MPTYTFRCPQGHMFDRRVSRDTYQVPSDQHCGCVATAERLAVYAVNFCGFKPAPVGERSLGQEFKDYSEASAELEYQHSRNEEAAGKPLLTPRLFTAAKAEAQRLTKLGVKDSADIA